MALVGTINSSNDFGLKNRIINGAMVIDQRNSGASVTVAAGGSYTLDRWQGQASQASKYTVQQSSTAPAGFVSSAKLTSSSAYSLTSGDYFQFQQSIEGFNAADLNWGTANAKSVTLSFWVNASVTGTYGLFFVNNASNRIYSTTYTVSSANTWEQKTITIIGDTSGTWETTNSTGIRLAWILGYGSTYTGATANVWATLSSNFAVNGCVNFLGTNGATFYITGVQLEKGSTATSFDYRSYGTELAMCQRYYYQYSSSSLSDNVYLKSPYVSSFPNSSASVAMYFPTTMRAAPTMSGTLNTGSISRQSSMTDHAVFQMGSTSGSTAYAITSYTATAEL